MTRWTALTTVILFAHVAHAAEAAQQDARWMVVMLDGRKLGYAVERVHTDEQGNIESSASMRFSLERMGQAVSLSMETRFIEARDGTPLTMLSRHELGTQSVEERYEFTRGFAGDEVIHETVKAGGTTRTQRSWPEGTWLTPVTARRELARRLAAGDRAFTITTLDPTVGLTPIVTTYSVLGPSTIEVMGRTVPSIKWTLTQSAMPGVISTEHVDAQGRPLRGEIVLGGMRLEMLSADQELAMLPFDPPELMARTLVEPSGVNIDQPRSVRSASYVLSLDEGDFSALDRVPSAGAQRVERVDERRVRVTVRAGRTGPAGAEAHDPRLLDAGTMVDARDDAVVELARSAAADLEEATPITIARALERAVSAHIEHAHLGVGLATASEVARTRTGDCTEYAVLLAATLRARNIPSRVVSGVVFVDELAGARRVFGYHMWTQALVRDDEGHAVWIDLDSAIPTPALGGIDATHIALATTTLSEDDAMGSMAAMVGVLGRLSIHVEHVEP